MYGSREEGYFALLVLSCCYVIFCDKKTIDCIAYLDLVVPANFYQALTSSCVPCLG